jgi:phosphatidylglycerophosphatase GEP4
VIISNSAGTNDDLDYKDKFFSLQLALNIRYKHTVIQAQKLENSLDVSVLRHSEKKPSGGQALAKHLYPIPANQTAFVGDRILTDVLFGNRNGNLTIWTRKVITEEGDNKAALVVK